jgi:hypothetical protein
MAAIAVNGGQSHLLGAASNVARDNVQGLACRSGPSAAASHCTTAALGHDGMIRDRGEQKDRHGHKPWGPFSHLHQRKVLFHPDL